LIAALINFIFFDLSRFRVLNFFKPLLTQARTVEHPQNARLRLVKESQCKLISAEALFALDLIVALAKYTVTLADDEGVIAGLACWQQFLVDHSSFVIGIHLDHELLLVVVLVVVDRKILTIEVEKALRQYIAGECP